MARKARLPFLPVVSIALVLIGASGAIEASASAAPRSQSAYRVLFFELGPTGAVVPRKSMEYLRVTGPGVIRLVKPVKTKRAPRPTFPPNEELARDPEAYAKAAAERAGYGEVASSKTEKGDEIRISVGSDVLPEVSVSPYSHAGVRPEDVVLFFKDEELDGLRGGIVYPAARLRFDPARRDVRASSSATYTSQ